MAREIIFVPLNGAESDQVVLKAAAALAGSIDGDVVATFIGYDQSTAMMIAGDGYGGVGGSALQALQDETGKARERARQSAEAVGASFRDFQGHRSQATRFARLARVAVVDPVAARGEGPFATIFDNLLFEDGTGVLVPRGDLPPRRLGVAWDGSREAARAMKVAAPLFAAIPESVVLQASGEVDERDEGSDDPEFARDWIERRGGTARVERVDPKREAGAAILEACRQHGVDLLVAGAYGHTRLREVMFGGFTRSLVRASSPSLFLAH